MNRIGYATRLMLTVVLVTGIATGITATAHAQTPYGTPPSGGLNAQTDDEYVGEEHIVSGDSPKADAEAIEGRVIEGQVAAASESGELLLRTDNGLIAFLVAPEEIQGVSIGQTVRVSDDQSQ